MIGNLAVDEADCWACECDFDCFGYSVGAETWLAVVEFGDDA